MKRVSLFLSAVLLLASTVPTHACETCALIYKGKNNRAAARFSAKVLYEYQDFDTLPAGAAHDLHEDGHDVHNKINDRIVHTVLTWQAAGRLSVEVNIPYVRRRYLEVHSDAHVGEKQTSAGLGDIIVTGDYRFFREGTRSFGLIAGLKTPSGQTEERSSFGALIEPELQPGTGSLDYILGFSGTWQPADFDVSGSALYVYRTEGDQDFRAGDLLSVSVSGGRTFRCENGVQVKAGILLNNQLAKKDNDAEGDVKDSGGYTLLAGPHLSFRREALEAEFAYLAPAVQNLGGVHQELESGIWTGAVTWTF